MHVVMVGCGGFVGRHLVEAVLEKTDWQIDGFDLVAGKISHLLMNPRLHFHAGDAYAHPQLDAVLQRADVVISLAAICNPSRYNTEPLRVIEANYFGPARLAEKCAHLGRWLIQFSTSEVYGKSVLSQWPRVRHSVSASDSEKKENPETAAELKIYTEVSQFPDSLWQLNEDTSPLLMGPVQQQRWSYASAKQLLERTVVAQHHEQGLRYTLIRPFNFLGLHMDYLPGLEGEGLPRVLANFTAHLLRGQPLPLVDGGKARRTFLCVREAAAAIIAIIQNPETCQNQIFNLGNPKNEVTIEVFAERIKMAFALASGNTAWNEHPIKAVSASSFYGPGYEDSDRRLPDIAKASLRFGFSPQRSLDQILLEVAQHHLALYPTQPVDDHAQSCF